MIKYFSFPVMLCLFCSCLSIEAKAYNYILVQDNGERRVYLDKDSVECTKGLCYYMTKIELNDDEKPTAINRGLRPETKFLKNMDVVTCTNSPILGHLVSMECVSEKNCKEIYNTHDVTEQIIVEESDTNGSIYRFVCFK